MNRPITAIALATLSTMLPAGTAAEPDWATAVDVVCEQLIDRSEAVGLSVAVGVDGEIVYDRALGWADLEQRAALEPDSLMRVASVTKQFTAAGIMKLIDRGSLSIDTTLAEALPDWPIPIDQISGKAITIEQLLTHSSGLRNFSGLDRFTDDFAARTLSLQDAADLIKEEPFTHEPGTAWRYSNTGYWLLGKIIERTSGTDLNSFFRAELLTPAGMTQSRIDSNDALIVGRVHGYDITSEGIRNDHPLEMRNVGGAGALLSTARELVEWTIALSSGSIVPQDIYAAMSTAQFETGRSSWSYGYGLLIDSSGDRARVFHTGGINGFNALLAQYAPTETDPRGIIIAVICNGTNPRAKVETRNATVIESLIAEAVLNESK